MTITIFIFAGLVLALILIACMVKRFKRMLKEMASSLSYQQTSINPADNKR